MNLLALITAIVADIRGKNYMQFVRDVLALLSALSAANVPTPTAPSVATILNGTTDATADSSSVADHLEQFAKDHAGKETSAFNWTALVGLVVKLLPLLIGGLGCLLLMFGFAGMVVAAPPQSTLVMAPVQSTLAAVDAFSPENAAKPAKSCSCSPQCTCGCNDGARCRCAEMATPTAPRSSPAAYDPVTRRVSSPTVTMAPPVYFRAGGGGSC